MIWVLSNIHFDNGLLPRFLRYYRQRGVERFGLLVHGDFKSPFLERPDIEVVRIAEEYKGGSSDNDLLHAFRKTRLNADDWYIPADIDEFYWTPGLAHFEHLTGNWDYISARFVDRLPADGVLKNMTNESLDSQCPLASSITAKLCNGCDEKCAMLRGHIETNSGHHFAIAGKRAPFAMQMHHFKWFIDTFWHWAQHKEKLYQTILPVEINFFREHYKVFNGINILDFSFDIYESPLIGI